mmetsp:Transcript_39509/g.79207  ORF Transcript_39509/g.79207 Transcript_39509/m.79207 type:complete len:110 (-) Transcript_39509:49-378(-)
MDAMRGEPVCPPRYTLHADPASPCRFPGCLLCDPSKPKDGALPVEPKREVTTSVAFMISLLFASCVLAWMFNGTYKRMEAEEASKIAADAGAGDMEDDEQAPLLTTGSA